MSVPTNPSHPQLRQLGGRPGIREYFRDIWRRRDFAVAISTGEIRSQNMDTVLGNIWHLLNPLLLAGVYYLIFGVLLGDVLSRGVDNFALFIVVGVMSFHFSQKSIISGAQAVTSNEGLIRSIRFPRAILPISTVLGQAIAFVPALFVMVVISLITGETPRWAWFLLVPLFLVQTVFNVGAAFIVARLTDSFKDVANLLPFLFRLMFYFSGVLYPVTRFIGDSQLQLLFDFNPFYVFVTLFRGPMLGEMEVFDTYLASIGLGWTALLLVGGFFYFRAGEERYGRA